MTARAATSGPRGPARAAPRGASFLLLAALALAGFVPTTARADGADAGRAAIRAGLRHAVAVLAALGPRHRAAPEAYAAAAALIRERLAASGLAFEALDNPAAPGAGPVIATLPAPAAPGAAAPLPLVLVAHYDTVPGSPGALDNASGVAVLLEVARLVAPAPPPGLRIVFAPEEEEPHFMTPASGSVFYAALLAARGVTPGDAVAVDSPGLADAARAVWDPARTAPDGVPDAAPGALSVGARPASRGLALALAAALEPFAPVRPVVAAPGLDWVDRSDHAAFAAHGWRAALVTSPNVALAPCMHQACDLPGGVDFAILENTVQGMMRLVFQAQGGRL